MTKIHHLYLALKDFETTKEFYLRLFEIIQLKHISTLVDYNLYVFGNDLFDIGIMPVSQSYTNDTFDKFRIGMSHIAFAVDTTTQLEEVSDLITTWNLTIEANMEIRSHHGINLNTTIFYCPSGIKIEIVMLLKL